MSARDHHRPVKFDPALFDQRIGGVDPAVLAEAAHVTASAVLHRGRGHEDPEVRRRLVEFTDTEGLDGLAALWSEAPPVSLPGALWRLYALRSAVQADPVRLSRWFEAGRDTAQVSYVVAGVADPPRAAEIREMADAILSGAWNGDFDVALERFAAFCHVTALGRTRLGDPWASDDETRRTTERLPSSPAAGELAVEAAAAELDGERMARQEIAGAQRLERTADDLEAAARAWRAGSLD